MKALVNTVIRSSKSSSILHYVHQTTEGLDNIFVVLLRVILKVSYVDHKCDLSSFTIHEGLHDNWVSILFQYIYGCLSTV